jgi:hypothetical protein
VARIYKNSGFAGVSYSRLELRPRRDNDTPVELVSGKFDSLSTVSVVLTNEQVDDLIANLTALRERSRFAPKGIIEGEDYRT